MSGDEAKVMGLCVLIALKHSTPDETEVILGAIHDTEEEVEETGKIGFNLSRKKRRTPPQKKHNE